jgi:hypothetical protein
MKGEGETQINGTATRDFNKNEASVILFFWFVMRGGGQAQKSIFLRCFAALSLFHALGPSFLPAAGRKTWNVNVRSLVLEKFPPFEKYSRKMTRFETS